MGVNLRQHHYCASHKICDSEQNNSSIVQVSNTFVACKHQDNGAVPEDNKNRED